MVMVSLALPFAGCKAVGPDFVTPPAPIADQYLGIEGVSLPEKREENREWWKAYNDPTLNHLIDLAYSQNLTLLSAGTRVLEARAVLAIAVGDLYPQQQQVVGGLNYNRLSKVDVFSPINPSSNFWRASIGVQLAWELDFWGKFRRGIESADAGYLASIAAYDDVLVALLGDVATNYIGIRTVEKQIELARANIARQRKALGIAQERFKGGSTSRLDVYQAQNVLGATEARVPQLMIQLEQQKNALRVLLGMAPKPLDDILAQSSGIPTAPADVAIGIPADLLRRRPDIRTAELHAAAQSAQIGIAKSELYPSFSLVGSVGLVSSNVGSASLGDIFTMKGLAYSFGPTIQWNILNYGQITNNVRAQDARTQALLIDYQNTVLKAQQQVQDAIASFFYSNKQAAFLHASVVAATGALDLAFTQYREGLSDFTTVLTAEQNLLDAENNFTIATGTTSSSVAAIYRAVGGGWEIRDGNDFVPPATRDEMRKRTNWGDLLPPSGGLKPTPPQNLPSPADRGPTVQPVEW